MNRLTQMITATHNGIRPGAVYWAMKAADDTGLPFYLLCAVLEKESSGGLNIFGHDRNRDGSPRPFYGAGRVTKKKYLAYKEQRLAGLGSQGVGPMQLTYFAFQDQADALGGCWKPRWNILVGARFLKQLWDKYDGDIVQIGKEYNGHLSYGLELEAVARRWKSILKVDK